MDSKEKHLILRELLIDKIWKSNSPIKPNKINLLKETDERLINLLFENAIFSERELWREDIIKKILQLEPGTENKYKSSGTNLLTSLINVVKRNNN